MNKEEWQKMIKVFQEKIKTGEIKKDSWDAFIHYYVDYDCKISHEFLWNYNGIEYGLYPLEEFGKYQLCNSENQEAIIYKSIFDALEQIRLDEKSLKELYDENLIIFEIT